VPTVVEIDSLRKVRGRVITTNDDIDDPRGVGRSLYTCDSEHTTKRVPSTNPRKQTAKTPVATSFVSDSLYGGLMAGGEADKYTAEVKGCFVPLGGSLLGGWLNLGSGGPSGSLFSWSRGVGRG
jgi:hypothetical protein